MGKIGQRPAVQVLTDALVYTWVAAFQVKQGAHDVDVNFLRHVLWARDYLVGKLQDEIRELLVIEVCITQRRQVF